MTKFEQLVVSKKNYEEIALFLDVSIGWVRECLDSELKPIRQADSFRDLIISDNSIGKTVGEC